MNTKTLPLLVADLIIATQEIVCQEKNGILEIFFTPLKKNETLSQESLEYVIRHYSKFFASHVVTQLSPRRIRTLNDKFIGARLDRFNRLYRLMPLAAKSLTSFPPAAYILRRDKSLRKMEAEQRLFERSCRSAIVTV